MVEVKDIAEKIQTILNTNSIGKVFKIFSNVGELKKNTKRESEYRNGLVEIVQSNISTVENMQFLTISTNLTLYVNVDLKGNYKDGANQGDSIEVTEIYKILNDMISVYNWQTINETFGNKTYTTTYGFKFPTNLQKISLGYINECLPVVMTIDLTLFENGVNSNQWEIKVNGEPIAYTRCVLTRIKTSEQNPGIINKSTKSSIQTNSFGVDFVMPQLQTKFSNAVEREILGEESDMAYCLELKGNASNSAYICALGNTQSSLDRNSNVGFNISLVEHIEELLNYQDNIWVNIPVEIEAYEQDIVTINNLAKSLGKTQKIIIFWGDGKHTISSEDEISHTYSENGDYTIRCFYSNAENSDWVNISFPEYNIIYTNFSGTSDNPNKYNKNDLPITLSSPDTIMEFTGWSSNYISDVQINPIIPESTRGDLTFVANYNYYAIPITSLTYELNDDGDIIITGINGTISESNAYIPNSYVINGEVKNVVGVGGTGTTITLTDINIILPNSLKYVGGTFRGVSTVNFEKNSNCEEIRNGAFFLCTSLTSVTIPNSVTSIGNNAFAGCTSLTTVTFKSLIPPVVGDGIFENSDALRSIYCPSASLELYETALRDYVGAYVSISGV